MTETIIETSGVEKSFGDDKVLNGIDLEIRADETTVLMGPNGSGKTILLSCIAGGLHPSAGDITVLGKPPAGARTEMNFMLQGGLALPELSGRENIEFYTSLHPKATDGWRDITDRVALTEELDKRVRHYSGGMVRKLELAIAMSVDVPLYLLDEPVAELDLTTIDQFHALIRRERDHGKTVVISNHAPANMEIADRIVFVVGGRVVTDGNPDTLFDAIPPVVTVAGRADIEKLRDQIRAGRFFDGDTTRRGFLAEEADSTTAEKRDGVRIEEPTWTDLFNYYVHIAASDANTGSEDRVASGATNPDPCSGATSEPA